MSIDRKAVYEKYQGRCAYCGKAIEFREMQVDHFIPIARATADNQEKIYSFENLMPSCRRCNHYKRQSDIEAFRRMIESIDDYWIGKRLDNFYYAEWNGNYFVWTHSRYLPWGEHIVDEGTLWKEHTYPSEPREISFSEWIVGFMKKHGSKVSEDNHVIYGTAHNCILTMFGECSYNETGCGSCAVAEKIRKALSVEISEDCISREYMKSLGYINKGDFNSVETIREWIDNAPSVVPSRAEGEWIVKQSGFAECSVCEQHYFSDYNYCPNYGAKMKGAED